MTYFVCFLFSIGRELITRFLSKMHYYYYYNYYYYN